jgi:gas vesicle protein
MTSNNTSNSLVYLLAGFGLGALLGAAAGLLFAPKAGPDSRDDLANKFADLKTKTEDWINEQKAKKSAKIDSAESIGA